MTEDPRQIRDVLGEALWRAPGFRRRPWAYWNAVAPDETEAKRREADAVIRILDLLGCAIAHSGNPRVLTVPTSPVIYRDRFHAPATERVIRRAGGDDWQIVSVVDGRETVEQTFTIAQALLNGGLVLSGHPDAKRIPGLGSQLAALNEIYRLNAAEMGPA